LADEDGLEDEARALGADIVRGQYARFEQTRENWIPTEGQGGRCWMRELRLELCEDPRNRSKRMKNRVGMLKFGQRRRGWTGPKKLKDSGTAGPAEVERNQSRVH
jgi:hypothetical protein